MNAIPATGTAGASSAGEQGPAPEVATGVDFVALLQAFLAGLPAAKAPSSLPPTALTDADATASQEDRSGDTGGVPAAGDGGMAEPGPQVEEGPVVSDSGLGELALSTAEPEVPVAWRWQEQGDADPLFRTIAARPREDRLSRFPASTDSALATIDARDALADAEPDQRLEEGATSPQPATTDVQAAAGPKAAIPPFTEHAREGALGEGNSAEVLASPGIEVSRASRGDPAVVPRDELAVPRQPRSLGVPLEPSGGHSLALRAARGEALGLELPSGPNAAPELAPTGDRWTPTPRVEALTQSADREPPQASRGPLRSGPTVDAQVVALRVAGTSSGHSSQGRGTSTARREVRDYHIGRSPANSESDVLDTATSDRTGQSVQVIGIHESRTSLPDGIAKPALARSAMLSEAPSGAASQESQLQQQITLRLDDGGAARLRITVRGDRVEALIVEPDSAAAGRLFGRVEELRAALQRSGFTDPIVVVRAPSQNSDAQAGMTAPNDVVALRTTEGQPARDSRSSSFSHRRQDEGGSQGQGRSHQRSGRERER